MDKENPMTSYHFARAFFALLFGVCSTLLLAEDTRSPDTVAPETSVLHPLFQLAVVVEANKSTSEITLNYAALRRFVVTQRESGVVIRNTIRDVSETTTATLPLAGFSLYDAKGNKLTVDAFFNRVRKTDVILIYEGGRLPDPKYLRIFKDDTLVLVRGDANTAPVSANPAPAGYMPNRR
jgi:hypothetical protein